MTGRAETTDSDSGSDSSRHLASKDTPSVGKPKGTRGVICAQMRTYSLTHACVRVCRNASASMLFHTRALHYERVRALSHVCTQSTHTHTRTCTHTHTHERTCMHTHAHACMLCTHIHSLSVVFWCSLRMQTELKTEMNATEQK